MRQGKAFYRSMGNPKLGLSILSISMCANTFLNWVLIFGNLGTSLYLTIMGHMAGPRDA